MTTFNLTIPLKSSSKKNTIGLIHKVYISQLKNSQKNLASTKTKSEVRGGGKKPRPQKGQGYARSGSIRSPLWVGGGVIFGPKPHIVRKKINKKERKLAIISAFYLKKNQFKIVDDSLLTQFGSFKTKSIIEFLSTFGIKIDQIQTEKFLFILSKPNRKFWLACRNLKHITVTTALCLNLHDLLHTNHIFFSQESLKIINSNYNVTHE